MKTEWKWAKRHDACRKCERDVRRHVGNGYCSACYPLVAKIKRIQQWDQSDPETLSDYRYADHPFPTAQFSKIKLACVKQVKARLQLLRWRANQGGYVNGLTIEHGLTRLARLAGVRDAKRLFHGMANSVDHSFDQNQKRMMDEWIGQILEAVPWQGINWNQVLDESRR